MITEKGGERRGKEELEGEGWREKAGGQGVRKQIASEQFLMSEKTEELSKPRRLL